MCLYGMDICTYACIYVILDGISGRIPKVILAKGG